MEINIFTLLIIIVVFQYEIDEWRKFNRKYFYKYKMEFLLASETC